MRAWFKEMQTPGQNGTPYFLALYLFWIDLKPWLPLSRCWHGCTESSVLFWGFSEFLHGSKVRSFLVSPIDPNWKNAFTMCRLKKPPDYVSFISALTSYSIHDSAYPFITSHQKARFSPCEVESQLHYLLAMKSEHVQNMSKIVTYLEDWEGWGGTCVQCSGSVYGVHHNYTTQNCSSLSAVLLLILGLQLSFLNPRRTQDS